MENEEEGIPLHWAWRGFLTGEPVGLAASPPDKTAVAKTPATPSPLPRVEIDRRQRTLPLINGGHFKGMNAKEIREEVLRIVKEKNVKASPTDMDYLEESGVLFPDETPYAREFMINNFKRKLYMNNPDWEKEEREWKRRKREGENQQQPLSSQYTSTKHFGEL